MVWTKVEEIKLRNWTILVVSGDKTIDQVPEKYREEVQRRVDAWFTAEALAAKQTETI